MNLLPRNISQKAFESCLIQLRELVGKDWVMTSEADILTYRDDYGIYYDHSSEPLPCGAVAPQSTEEVQAVVKVLNTYGIPCWTISTGKNLGYGGAAPMKSGMITIDLKRMNKIIEVNEKHAYAIVEPGVSYFDLFNYIQKKGYKLWMSVPSPGWGSVIGNAVEHGGGYTPYGDHFATQCGMEIVLPDGELLRTGMGAMPNTETWATFKYGFGPHIDGLFSQSNYGIVTKMGIWLMPEPPAYMSGFVMMDGMDDLSTMVEATRDLRQQDIITNMASIFPSMIELSYHPEARKGIYEFTEKKNPLILMKLMKEYNVGFWNNRIAFYGLPKSVQEKYEYTVEHYKKFNSGTRFKFKSFKAPYDFKQFNVGEKLQAGVPSMGEWTMMGVMDNMLNAHMSFSPILPFTKEAIDEHIVVYNEIYEKHGRGPYIGGVIFFSSPRTCLVTLGMPIKKGDHDFNKVTIDLINDLIKASAERGWGEYRSPTFAMDMIMDTYSFNNHALRRFHEGLKDHLDPNGIFSPGKNGIWPKKYRDSKSII